MVVVAYRVLREGGSHFHNTTLTSKAVAKERIQRVGLDLPIQMRSQ